ncbi:PQQ-binding-like beta-propeller repeat protein [Nocardia sp. 852002-20019_SCH5090214]|uniref:outer membrane protein assembly factor BamB family protein n=1 Tax=Nocardia sp. 852002-20019_SCH5090214 TaxID=1834087 RepID=UPI000A6F4AAB|nr:PQQ-binding-like beta-propeller repeat protein [Nocardia sp. 852002-20019_SCH5090214]
MQARYEQMGVQQVRSGSRRPERSEHDRGGHHPTTLRHSVIRGGAPRRAIAAVGALGLLALTGCGSSTVDDIKVGSGKGWQSAFHDARNSGASPVTGARHLSLSWSRPIGGPLANATTIGPDGQLFVTSRTTTDCVGKPGTTGMIFSFQMPTGRKRFCNALGPDAVAAASAVDGASNVYVGDDGGVFSFNALGQPRWRTPVAGVPVSVQFTHDGTVLSVSQSGQVDVLDRQTGDREVSTYQVLGDPDFLAHPNVTRPADGQGVDDCAVGGPQCAVANVSALDPNSGRFYLTAWRTGAPAASVVALHYADKKVTQDWSVDILTGGSATSPTLSSDGKALYVGDNSGRLLAVDTADGHTKWTQPLGFAPRGGISELDGLLIPGGDDGHLMALHDNGDRAEIAWERKDLTLRGRPVQTAGDTGYVVVPMGDALHLLTFETKSGKTIASAPLPGAQGTTVSTAIGPDGQVVVGTRIGELFAFTPDR